MQIGNSVQTIGYSVFGRCTGLTSVSIPNSVQTIGSSAFYGCSGFTSVVIPDSLTSIGNLAFSSCTGLTSIYYNSENPIECDAVIFDKDSYSKATLYLPEKGVNKAKQIDPWKNFIKIEAYDFGGVNDVVADKQGEIDYNAPYEIYNYNGMKVGDNKESLAPGLYIIRQCSICKKIAIQ
ncbi:MAG: leucine-rich repeat domain-containing protein [Muribaculaceae bacterium]|nr:leucine-rich repeat domain-containing protein [Muribaculaceae bacterium]